MSLNEISKYLCSFLVSIIKEVMSDVRLDLNHNRKQLHLICDQIQSTLKNPRRTIRLNLGLYRRQNSCIHKIPQTNLHPNPFVSCPTGIVMFHRLSFLPIKAKNTQKNQRLPNTSNALMVLYLSILMTLLAETRVRRSRLYLHPLARISSTHPSPHSLRK